jgi:hypothetical protein
MKKSLFSLVFLSFFTYSGLTGQMIDGTIVKYGNEWIDYERDYFKIPVDADGLYKISFETLLSAGLDAEKMIGKDFQVHEFGKEVPILVSNDGIFSNGDYIMFYGKRNRGELDKYLYEQSENQLNPDYSLFTDTLNYFLSLKPGAENLRYDFRENDLSGSLPPAEEYYWHEEKIINHSSHFKPTYDGNNKVSYSHLDIAEGFASPMQQYNEYTISIRDYIDIGADAFLKFRLSTSTSPHKTEVSVNNQIIETLETTGFSVSENQLIIPAEEIQDEMVIGFRGTDVSTNLIDRNAQAYVSIRYPRLLNFEGLAFAYFMVEPSTASRYFEISGMDLNQQNVQLWDITNGFVMLPEWDQSANQVKFLLPPSSDPRQLILFNSETVPAESEITEPIKFIDYSLLDEDYIILSNKLLFEEYNGVNQVQAYADYRSSDEGGNHKTMMVDVNQLYDQFGYGIHRHSQSLNNFITYIHTNWTQPKAVFIIGKGRDYVETRTNEQLSDPSNLFYVPTYGYHGADVMLAAAKGESSPLIPIGRIAVKTPQQIEEYLEKVKQHENYQKYAQTLEDKAWMKKVIHLSGGDANIQDQLRSYLDAMGDVIANNYFGANVVTYGRTSGTATEAVTERIVKDISEGASIITFFGHSGVSTSDFNIGDLENEKFPLFISLGCYSGDIHTKLTTGQSEKFVLSPNGVIAFLGAAGTAYITPQYIYGKDFYHLIGYELYGKSIGEVVKAILDQNKDSQSLGLKSLNQQFTLHGDPAIRLNPHEGPDYLCDYKTAATNPSVVNSNENDFAFNLDLVNIGRWMDDTLGVQIIREYPNGDLDTTYMEVPEPKYRSTLTVKLPTGGFEGIGRNCLFITLDYENKIEEKLAPDAESNNELVNDFGEAGYCFYVINNGAKPIYPAEFSIVNKEDVSLRASTYNYFIEPQSFVFQIDTTELFNSPLLEEHKDVFKGGMLEWKPPMDFQEETVYYWRISPDTLNTGVGYVWSNSSFVYIPGSGEGWNQSHQYQFEKNEIQGINPVDWGFKFSTGPRELAFKVKKYDPDDRFIVRVNGTPWGSVNPTNFRPAINILVWGPERILFNESGTDYGSIQNNKNGFLFKTQTIDQRKGIKDLFDAIPDSSIVFVYTILDNELNGLNIEEWEQDSVQIGYNLFSIFEEQGAKNIRQFNSKGTVPYLFVFQKAGKTLFEEIGKDIDDIIEYAFTTTIFNTSGNFESTLIGPAKKWDRLHWNRTNFNQNDYSHLIVYKFSDDLVQQVVVDTLINESELDLTNIDSESFPFLKLNWFAEDDADYRDPPKMNFWRIFFEGLPDAAIVFDDYTEFRSDTLDFGDTFRFKATALNHSSINMDSLDVRYTVKNSDNEVYIHQRKYSPLLAGDTIHIGFNVNTDNFEGINEFTVELNPDHNPEEQFYFNNIGIKRFFVGGDTQNPILDVTFDGVHIMDGDIVSPKPEISMRLKDENQFLLLNDPGIFKKIELTTPSGEVKEIPVESALLEFLPAESTSENIAQMIFRPELTEEGEYTLTVQGRDISNNSAGKNEFRVNFMVILKEQISNVYNYPNPFSNSTQFIFTLTGYEVPEDLTIRIMTISGKVVREITKEELGPLRIGQNITEYTWDGRDEFGEKLGNGVYLYQVRAQNAGGDKFELMETNPENDARFFKKGWGKMAILR